MFHNPKSSEDLDRIRDKLNELIREQNKVTEHLDSVEPMIQDVHQSPKLDLSIHSLTANGNSAAISHDLLPVLPPLYRTIQSTAGSFPSITCNDQYLLVHRKPHLCLIDRQLTLVQDILWYNDFICDMFWSSTLFQFIVITKRDIFMLDERTMTIDRYEVPENNKRNWFCGTCSDNTMFLSTMGRGPSISEYTLQPSFQYIKEWQPPKSCAKDEAIDDLHWKNGSLAIIIFNWQSKKRRLELRSSTTFERLWSIQLNHVLNEYRIRCCSINSDQWLAIDEVNSQLLHISSNGELLKRAEYNIRPMHAVQFGRDVLAISTVKGVNLHKLS